MSDEPKSCSNGTEPTVTTSAVSMWIFVALLLMLFLGLVFYDKHSGWFDVKVYSPYGSAEQLEAYQPVAGAAAAMARGKKTYETVCGICHAPDGTGKPGQAPPLAGSEWVNSKGVNRLARIPLQGLNGPVEVKGQRMTFPNGMVAVGAGLSDTDLAAVLTYIRGSWGNKADEVTADDIKAIRAQLGASPKPATSEQLKALPE
jgi:mono/diheme cytochrome c family protein